VPDYDQLKRAITRAPFAATSTSEERGAGFVHVDLPGLMIHAVVRYVDDRLMAIKVEPSSGTTSYALVDRDSLQAVHAAVATLAELVRRYPAVN
jgi:hypothetical protein